MTRYEWLLFLHVLGAFLLLSGSVAVAAIQLSTVRRERPSEIALLLRLTRLPVLLVGLGAVMVLVFGVSLALDVEAYDLTDGWIVGALLLWAVSVALGSVGGARAKQARLEAERLARGDDRPTPELRRLVRDPAALALNLTSGAAVVAILALMIWKPGAS